MAKKPWYRQRTTWAALLLLANQLLKVWFPGAREALITADYVLAAFTAIFMRQGFEDARSSRAEAPRDGQAPGL